MKKLYQGKGRRVHPVPPPPPPASPDAALALLPVALMTLAAALTAEEQEVLAYLLSGIGTGGGCGGAAGGGAGRRRKQSGPHQPEMGCGCFGCYKSFWARWDASPNRHLIHRIIEAVEEGAHAQGGGPAGPGAAGATRRGHRRRRRGRGGRDLDAAASDAVEAGVACVVDLQPCCASDDGGEDGDYEDDGVDSVYGGEGEEAMTDDSDCASSAAATAEKSTVGKLVRFIGEKVWGPWT